MVDQLPIDLALEELGPDESHPQYQVTYDLVAILLSDHRTPSKTYCTSATGTAEESCIKLHDA